MGGIDTVGASTIDELKATLVHALEQGDAGLAAALYEPGERLLDSGKYLVVFHRRPDGSWRYATDMWNSDAG
jgi:ketosteroid isomerase-like protein